MSSIRYPLAERLAQPGSMSADDLLERFLGFVADRGLQLYPAQEEAILEIMTGRHVILATPTGSGKSLVATAMVFRTLANGGRAFYTCPIKALVTEKFFALCDDLGPDKVGMMTGDATINPDAPVIVCTAEIVASMALREGVSSPVDGLIMDEFHYYADKERGVAWHLPLLLLSRTRFLLMSATLGDASPFLDRLKELTGREAALVESSDRPVPLDFTYSEEALHETVRDLVGLQKSPVYIVCFTQRACAEEAQNLMSENYCSKDEKRAINEALDGVRFDSPYGKDVSKFVRHGIGLHHAGLLPKYRLLVEKLAQEGLLKVICGTDTLGVGVNIPIRTVLFTKLCKFDGEKTGLLTVREFQQIAGRAGRKGFDVQGSVVAQAPEHAIENIKIDAKRASDPKKYKKLQRAKPPNKGYVAWDRATFDKLVTSKPEELVSRFALSHGMLIDLLDNPDAGKRGGYGMLLDLIERSHISARDKRVQRKLAPVLFRSLRRANIIKLVPRSEGRRGKLAILEENLQHDFSLMHALSLYLLEVLPILKETAEEPQTYAFDVLSFVEAILENPRAILEKQLDKAKTEKMSEMKAAGVDYDERIAELEKVEYPKPNAETIYATFNDFAARHPWVGQENVRPKSIARDMVERQATFDELVREYDLLRVEGVLLRYLSEVVKTLDQTVPDSFKSDALEEITAFLREEVRGVDSSLLDEWEERRDGKPAREKTAERPRRRLADDPKALLVRVRRELHRLVRLLAAKDWIGAAAAIRGDSDLDAVSLEATMKSYFAEHGTLIAHHEARQAEFTLMKPTSPGRFDLWQTLVDPERVNDWSIEAEVDVSDERHADLDEDDAAPLIRVRKISG